MSMKADVEEPGHISEAISTQDLIVRDNVYARVQDGISLELPSNQTVNRIVALNNWIELGTDDVGEWYVCGIRLKRSSADGFQHTILRGNGIRCDGLEYNPEGDYGIELGGCSSAIVENNLIDIQFPDNSVVHAACGSVKCFNNQTAGAEFLRGYNNDTGRHDAELTTDVEDVILGL